MTLELSWPQVAMLRLAPQGQLDPDVFGLRWRDTDALIGTLPGRQAVLEVVDVGRLRLLENALTALASGEPLDRKRVLLGALARIRGCLVGAS